jgi:S1-C subfamily serine protease
MVNLTKEIRDSIIKIESTNLVYDFIDPYKTPEQNQSVGTGFFILEKGSGYILTCCHVINRSINIEITIPSKGMNKYNASIICVNEDYDLALLKTDYKNNNYLEFFDSDDLIQGDQLSALGYPLGQERLKISNGILSGYEKYFLQTDAAINEGNSGGPLMNDNKVVGVNARKIRSIIANNIGYAVPIKLFMIMKEQYFENKIINRVNLLIKFKVTDKLIKEYYNNSFDEGVLITNISEKSSLYDKGLRKHDILIEFDKYKLNNYGEITFKENKFNLNDFIYRYKNNQKVSIKYYSVTEKKIIESDIELRKSNFKLIKIIPSINADLIKYEIISGLVFSDLNLNQIDLLERYNFNYSSDFINLVKYDNDFNKFENKIILTSVLKGSKFINNHNIFSGLFLEKINDKNLNTLDEMKKHLLQLKQNKVKFYKFEFSNNHLIIMDMNIIKEDNNNLKKLYKLDQSEFKQNFLNIYKINKSIDNQISSKSINTDIIGKVINNNFSVKHLFKIKKLKDGSIYNTGYKYLKE